MNEPMNIVNLSYEYSYEYKKRFDAEILPWCHALCTTRKIDAVWFCYVKLLHFSNLNTNRTIEQTTIAP